MAGHEASIDSFSRSRIVIEEPRTWISFSRWNLLSVRVTVSLEVPARLAKLPCVRPS